MPPRREAAPLSPDASGCPSPSRRRRAFGTTRGEVRGGGNPDIGGSAIPPPCPSPQGGGDVAARSSNSRPGSLVSSDPDPDGPVWQDGTFRRDAWAKADADGPLPDGPVVVAKQRWLAEREALASRQAPLGLQIEPGEAIDDIAADLPRFALVALNFPKFSDGRAFSTARLLREKHGFTGELRAVGNVLTDQIPFMRRVGFDSFEVSHAPTRRALAEGRIPEVRLYYQPMPADAAGTRPWLR